MKFLSMIRFPLFIILALSLFSCSKKEELATDKIEDYLQLSTGKYVTFRLDSMIFTGFGAVREIHSYQVKHVVDQQVTDNLGRPSWRVYTYLSDSTGTESWNPNGSYLVTVLDNKVELIQDNLRVIKLHLPIKEGFEWKGNSYLPDEPYGSGYDFSNDDDMENWAFYYDFFEPNWSYRNQDYTDVVTVEQQDEAENAPVVNVNNYGYKNRSVEKYSKGIGLVYREFELWEYQPNPSGSPYKTGFGVTMWMVDHN